MGALAGEVPSSCGFLSWGSVFVRLPVVTRGQVFRILIRKGAVFVKRFITRSALYLFDNGGAKSDSLNLTSPSIFLCLFKTIEIDECFDPPRF